MNVILAGPSDRQLEGYLRAIGVGIVMIPSTDLEALAPAATLHTDVLILDIRQASQLPSSLPIFRRQHPSTDIILVASSLDPTLMLEAMRSGVSEVVTDPITQSDLEAALARVVGQRVAPISGQVFAFLGAKGGVGTTTVAVNVVAALAKMTSQVTLLIDLHLAYGDAAVLLGAEPRFSVVDALENTHRFDEAFFRGLVVRTKSGADLLASSDRASVVPVEARRIRALVEFAARFYHHTVLDVPRSDASALDALEAATKIVVVANQELSTVRSAGRMAAMLRQRYGKNRVMVVVSRMDPMSEIGQQDIERAVGGPVKYSFPSAYRLALDALNKGRPLALDNHNQLASDFTTLARDLAGISVETKQPRSGLFGRIKGRRS